MESTLKRTWAEIDLDALENNYHKLREHVGADVKFLGVVKADAYGHGAVMVSRKLQEMGAKVIVFDDSIRVMRSGPLRQTTVKTRPYPGFPTDMQAQACVCMALARGTSRLTESVYETRFFGYCTELENMGANIRIDGKTALVQGVEQLHGSTVYAHDLRAGAALVIAGLSAKGTTTVEDIHYVERGYEDLIGKLTALGADIRRLEE